MLAALAFSAVLLLPNTLFAQAASFLPAADEVLLTAEPPVPSYLDALRKTAATGSIPKEVIAELRPTNKAQTEALRFLLQVGNTAEVRLVAILAANSAVDAPLTLELLRVGVSLQDEAAALACLLSPLGAPAVSLPSLAYLAQDAGAPLSTRAAATGLLLEAGCLNAWPMARSIFLSGTAADNERLPWAKWRRSGRYELPKRLLLIAVNRLLQGLGEPECGFEPNAAWAAQVKQVAYLEARFQGLPWSNLGTAEGCIQDINFQRAAAKLLDFAAKKSTAPALKQMHDASIRAMAMLAPYTHNVLIAALEGGNPARVAAAQAAAEAVQN